jgi:surfeit locus 1 family protein
MMTIFRNISALCTAFRPRLWTTALMLALVALFVALGQWQWGKAQRKAAAQARLDALASAPPIELPAAPIADADFFHYRRVRVQGRYRAAGQILLDNQMLEERVGYRVLTPLVIDGGHAEVLVDRGWVPAPADRRELPALAVPSEPISITGTAVQPATRRFSLAADTAPPGGNARWQVLDLGRYAREAGVVLQPVVIRLDGNQPYGYQRIWPRPDERHERHLSYALQWFGFAASTVAIWGWFGLRRKP